MRSNPSKLITSIIFSLTVGALGSIFAISAINSWYATLNKPFFNPPNFVFAPVWTIIYILMGISLYFLWTSKKKGKDKAIKLFLIQLVLNFFWSVVFFGLRSTQLAFVEIIALWIFIFMTIRQSSSVSKASMYLLYPYIVWVSFALVLNLFIAILN